MPRLIAILALCMTLGIATSATVSFAQTAQPAPTVSRADLIRMLGILYQDMPLRGDLVALGFQGENLELAVAQAQRVLRDPDVAGYIADRVLAVRAGEIPPAGMPQGLLWGVMDRGIGHLPLDDLRYYYAVEKTVLNAMSPRICGLAVRERLSPDRLAEATARVAARLNTPALRSYYRIQLRAAQLGATRDRVEMSAARALSAQDAIFAALTRQIAGRDDAARVLRSFTNLERADNRSACTAGRLFIDAVLTLKGDTLHEALIYLSLP